MKRNVILGSRWLWGRRLGWGFDAWCFFQRRSGIGGVEIHGFTVTGLQRVYGVGFELGEEWNRTG
jgi:hypothetical protein